MLARPTPDAPPTVALTDAEIIILDRLISDAGNRKTQPGTFKSYLTKLARLGGYLARAADLPPGNTVVVRGLTRLADIKLSAEIGTQRGHHVGNWKPRRRDTKSRTLSAVETRRLTAVKPIENLFRSSCPLSGRRVTIGIQLFRQVGPIGSNLQKGV
jgi:hypothetical protein